MKPLIAVTGPAKRLTFGWWATRLLLAISGMRGVYLTAESHRLTEAVHGVIIGGGDDIEPELYGLSNDKDGIYDLRRDAFEKSVIQCCLDQGIPTLGICRGSQLINVVKGGSLYPDIRPLREKTTNRNTTRPVKWVDVDQGSELARSMASTRVKVNSLHKQAIDRLGDGLTVAGRDADGFIQAVESRDGLMTGVQWHPEYLPYIRTQRRLFRAFRNQVCKRQAIRLPEDIMNAETVRQ